MSEPQILVRSIGGRLGVYLPQRPATAPTITVRDPSNGILGAIDGATATQDGVNTTLNGAVTQGTGAGGGTSSTGIVVASGTGIVAGRDYVIGSLTPETATEPSEVVRVRSVSGTTVILQWPLLYGHATTTPFYSTLTTYDVSAANASSLFRNGHAQWTWTDRASLVQHSFTRVNVHRRPPMAYGLRRYPHAVCTEADLFDRSPTLYRKVASTLNLAQAASYAHDSVLADLRLRFNVGGLIGAESLTDAVAWFMLAEIADAGVQDAALVTVERRKYDRALEILRSSATVDENEDASVDSNEGPRRSIRVSVGP